MNLKSFAITFVCVIIASVFLISAYFVYPPVATDGRWFITPAIHFANKGVLDSPLLLDEWAKTNKIINPYPHANRMLYYPPLWPLVLAGAIGGGAAAFPEDAFLVAALVNIAVIALSALLIYKLIAFEQKEITWFAVAIVVLSVLGIATNLYAEGGRPEVLTRLFILLGALWLVFVNKKYHPVIFGVLLGLIGATHPMGGVMFGVLAAATFAFQWKPVNALLFTLLFSVVGITVFAGAVTAGPYGVGDTLRGVWGNSAPILDGAFNAKNSLITWTIIRDYYFLNPNTSFYGPIILLLLIFGAIYWLKYRKNAASPALFYVWSGLFAVLIIWLLFYFVHLYYIILFAPFVFALISCAAANQKGFIKYAILLLVGLTGIGFLRGSVLLPISIKEGVSVYDARKYIGEKESVYGEGANVGVTGGLWALFNNYDNKYIYRDQRDYRDGTTAILFQEGYLGERLPPNIPNCSLEENYFILKTVTINKLKLANSVPGYAFAFYECAGRK